MSTVAAKTISSIILSVMGVIVIKEISGSKNISINLKSILLWMLLVLITISAYSREYNFAYSLLIYILTIITYKEMLNITITKSTISCGIMLFSLIFLDFIAGNIFSPFFTAEEARNIWYINVICNTLFSIIMIFFYSRRRIKENVANFVDKIADKKPIRIIVALVLGLIALSTILYTIATNYSVNTIFGVEVSLFIVFSLLTVSILQERNNFETLSDEYDTLFNYIQVFEDWIEKEQLTRHEYKNQLAVLRIMAKEKKVRDKIDSIMEDFINIDNDMISQLKNLPKGGVKGLLYYKMSICKKKKLNLTVDVNKDIKNEVLKIGKDNIKILTKLLGIYLDNAIEASCDSKDKLLGIEVYKSKDLINIVISNSYNDDKDITNRYNKGFSTKGKGRGIGLYFAKKLVSKNEWIEEKQEIVNNIYIQRLIVFNIK